MVLVLLMLTDVMKLTGSAMQVLVGNVLCTFGETVSVRQSVMVNILLDIRPGLLRWSSSLRMHTQAEVMTQLAFTAYCSLN